MAKNTTTGETHSLVTTTKNGVVVTRMIENVVVNGQVTADLTSTRLGVVQ